MKYLIQDIDPGKDGAKLEITGCYFASTPDGEGEGAHITRSVEGVTIRDITVFQGHLSRWGAIKWGVLGLLRMGPLRVQRLKRALGFGGK